MKNIIFYKDLKSFSEKILTQAGLDSFSIESVSNGLCETSLRGVDSHGIRLLPHYVKSALSGRKNPNPIFSFKNKFPTIGILDADNAFGHAAGMKAIDYAIKISDEFGIGAVAVKNSSHPGALATMALSAARKGYMGLAFTHADSLMLTPNGQRPYLGTNPICLAVPRKEKEPFCLDMATSMISWNKLLSAKSANLKLDNNYAADKYGNITNDPAEATSLLPAGSYKGFGLSIMVEIFCSVFTGMAFGKHIPSMYKTPMDQQRRLGQFYMTIRADGCVDFEEFISSMQELTDEIRNEPPQKNEKIMVPNDPEILCEKERRKNGIPLDDETFLSLKELSNKFNIELKTNLKSN